MHAQMIAVMKQTGFKGDFPAFLHFLRTDPQILRQDAARTARCAPPGSPRNSTARPRNISAICRARASPSCRCRMTWRRSTPSGRGGPGVYLVNTYDLPSRPLYNLTALTLHESAPGHAFQMPLALEEQEPAGVPPARPISPPMARAGRFIARGSASKWACITRLMTRSAC